MSAGTLLTTADHKRLGRMYLGATLAFLLASGVVGVLLRSSLDVSDTVYNRLLGLHGTSGTMLVIAPLWLGLAVYLVPLQIGAPRLAYPRLAAAAFWMYAFGGVAHLASYTGRGGGINLALSTPNAAGGRTDLWTLTLLVVGVASVLAAVNLLVTILKFRAPGLTLYRIPLFSWATLVTSAAVVIATPVFVAGLLLLYLDVHYEGSAFFGRASFGTQVVWQHTLWLFGRPEVYLLLVPGLGAASDIVQTAARRPLVRDGVARSAIAGVAILGFGAWAAGTEVADAVVLPTYSVATALVAAPAALVVLVWLDTLRRGPRFHPPLVFVAGALLLAGQAGLGALLAAVEEVEGGTAWSTGQAHIAAFGIPLLLAAGAVVHWAPKIWGREVPGSAAGLSALLLTGGVAVLGLGSWLAGWDDQPAGRNVTDEPLGWLTAAGGGVLALGVIALALGVTRAVLSRGAPAEDDPYGALTLEWATASPPPPHNFDSIPEVRSAQPLLDLRVAEEGAA